MHVQIAVCISCHANGKVRLSYTPESEASHRKFLTNDSLLRDDDKDERCNKMQEAREGEKRKSAKLQKGSHCAKNGSQQTSAPFARDLHPAISSKLQC